MGYPRIEKPHRFVCVCLFSPLDHASSMAKYLNKGYYMNLDLLHYQPYLDQDVFACLKSTSYAHFLSEFIARISNTEQPSCIDRRQCHMTLPHDRTKWLRPYELVARRHIK